MYRVRFRFYEELNDFLPRDRRKKEFTHTFPDRESVKDLIASVGVPHTKIDLILVNGVSVDFAYRVRDGDRISVYPVFESLDITPLVRLRPAPLRVTRFVADVHLGRLARYLRVLGFDLRYRNDYTPEDLVLLSRDEKRILLTRSRNLLKRRVLTHAYRVRSPLPRIQVREVVQRFDLIRSAAPFSRCPRCNESLAEVDKDTVLDLLPGRSGKAFRAFSQCSSCRKFYWAGAHVRAMTPRVMEWLAPADG